MSRRAILLIVVLFSCFDGRLTGQSPAKPVSASPSATSSGSPSSGSNLTTKALVDAMDPADLKEAIQLLRNNYIKPDALSETELNRATFEGVLSRLGRGVVLLPDSAAAQSEPQLPFYGEVLEDHVGYFRPGALNQQSLDALDTS